MVTSVEDNSASNAGTGIGTDDVRTVRMLHSSEQPRDTMKPRQANEKPLSLSDLRSLRALRDELRLKIHLGQQEARDRFQELEDRWSSMQRKLPQLDRLEADVDYAKAVLLTIGRRVVVDLMAGYRNLRDEVKKQTS